MAYDDEEEDEIISTDMYLEQQNYNDITSVEDIEYYITLYDIPRTKTAPVVLVEKFYALTGGIIAGIIGIIISGMDFNLVLLSIIILFVIFFLVYYRPVFQYGLKRITKFKFFSKYSDNITDSYESIII